MATQYFPDSGELDIEAYERPDAVDIFDGRALAIREAREWISYARVDRCDPYRLIRHKLVAIDLEQAANWRRAALAYTQA